MKTLKSIIATGILGAGLVLGGCGNETKDNQKYQNFANFIVKEGTFEYGDFTLYFSADSKRYQCTYDDRIPGNGLVIISIYDGKAIEHFQDKDLNGLDNYAFKFDSRELVRDSRQSKEDKDKYDMLIDSIPKWYAESKKEK